jgi:hypothetical protein
MSGKEKPHAMFALIPITNHENMFMSSIGLPVGDGNFEFSLRCHEKLSVEIRHFVCVTVLK